MAFKHKYSRVVVDHIRKRYDEGESMEYIANSIKEEFGMSMSRPTVRNIIVDDDYIAVPPKRSKHEPSR